MKPVVGVDVDGVLANFNAAYREMLIKVSGRDLIPEGFDPPVWDYAWYYGYTKAEDATAWARIKESYTFWGNLDTLPGAARFVAELGYLEYRDDIDLYFLTARGGVSVKEQTTGWLQRLYPAGDPTVLITPGGKVGIAQDLRLTHFIDDKRETCLDIAKLTHADVYMPARGCNVPEHPPKHVTVLHDGYAPFLQALDWWREKAAA